MNLSIVVGMSIWSFVATAFLIHTLRFSSKRRCLLRRLRRAITSLPESKRFDAEIALNEVMVKHIPWHQKSLSTVGAIAFFSMSAAALAQTISAQLSEFKASAAEKRFEYIQATTKLSELASRRSARAILAMNASDLARTPEMTEFLKSRLIALTDPRREITPTSDDYREAIAIAIAVRNPNCAAQIWRNNPEMDVGNLSLNDAELLAFSKLLYFLGDNGRAGDVLARIAESGSHGRTFVEQLEALRFLLSGRDSSVLLQRAQRSAMRLRVRPEDMVSSVRRVGDELANERSRTISSGSIDYCSLG